MNIGVWKWSWVSSIRSICECCCRCGSGSKLCNRVPFRNWSGGTVHERDNAGGLQSLRRWRELELGRTGGSVPAVSELSGQQPRAPPMQRQSRHGVRVPARLLPARGDPRRVGFVGRSGDAGRRAPGAPPRTPTDAATPARTAARRSGEAGRVSGLRPVPARLGRGATLLAQPQHRLPQVSGRNVQLRVELVSRLLALFRVQ